MSNPKNRDGFGDSAVLDLGEIEGTTHTFSNMPDSALDQDDDLGGGDTDELLGGSGQNPSGLKSYSFWYVLLQTSSKVSIEHQQCILMM